MSHPRTMHLDCSHFPHSWTAQNHLYPPSSLQAPVLDSCPFVSWATEFNQGCLCDHGFVRVHWSLVASWVGSQLKAMLAPLLEFISSCRKLRAPRIPSPSLWFKTDRPSPVQANGKHPQILWGHDCWLWHAQYTVLLPILSFLHSPSVPSSVVFPEP